MALDDRFLLPFSFFFVFSEAAQTSSPSLNCLQCLINTKKWVQSCWASLMRVNLMITTVGLHFQLNAFMLMFFAAIRLTFNAVTIVCHSSFCFHLLLLLLTCWAFNCSLKATTQQQQQQHFFPCCLLFVSRVSHAHLTTSNGFLCYRVANCFFSLMQTKKINDKVTCCKAIELLLF